MILLSAFIVAFSLQWSHGFPAMDTRRVDAGLAGQDVSPSMEPRLSSHGYLQGGGQDNQGRRVPSMEPRPFSHGYSVKAAIDIQHQFAPSMEPWLFSHGYATPEATPRPLSVLQWSRSLSAMDTPPRRSRLSAATRRFNGAMAFQPWIPDRIGNQIAGPVNFSMEPRPFSHGYVRLFFLLLLIEHPSKEP